MDLEAFVAGLTRGQVAQLKRILDKPREEKGRTVEIYGVSCKVKETIEVEPRGSDLWWLTPEFVDEHVVSCSKEVWQEDEARAVVEVTLPPPTIEGGIGYRADQDRVWIYFQHDGLFYAFDTPPGPPTTTWQQLKDAWLKDRSEFEIEGCEQVDPDGFSYEDLFECMVPLPTTLPSA